MMRLFNFVLVLVLLLGNFSNAQNVDIDYDCPGTPCELPLPIECKEQPAEFKGNIKSPGFPLKITNETQFGIYTLLITANCPFTIELTISRPNFLIGLPDNTFAIGVGDTVNSDFVGSPLKGTEQFPDNQDTLYYNKSGSSRIWVQIDVSEGFFWFEIGYTVTDAKEVLLTPCDQNDSYGVNWKTYKTEKMEKECSVGVPGALGTAFWECNCINNQCAFETSQPDFTGCQSSGLVNITESINNTEISVTEIWIQIEQFTANKEYYGQEIFQILIDAVDALLQRMQREIDENKNHLEAIDFLKLQINSSFYATQTMDHLVTNEAQWNQLINQTKGDDEILELLRVSNDIGFRLSNVSELAAWPLLCEIPFDNVTIMSSYWDETQGNLSDCTLKNVSFKENFYRFPMNNDTKKIESYIVIPDKIKEKSYKTAGVFIAASNLIQLLLPGSNNSQKMEYKEVNSPLISFTLYNPEANTSDEEAPLPNDSYVQLVFKHVVDAKYPSVRTLRRDPDFEGEESTVMGSSICSFLELNKTNSKVYWTWDDEGCRVLSTNSTHTVCKCTHLTGFADLMDFHDFDGRSAALDTTSMTCTILSIICLVSTFCILLTFRALKMKRTFVTQNLCITLIISYFMILLTLDKRFLHLDEVTCAVMGIMLHYMFLTSFMWMLLEGFQLYRMSVNVFGVLTRKWTIYYAIVAYTVPFFIVGVTVLTANSFEPRPPNETSNITMTGIMQAYSGEETCWLVGNWVWAFNGPVAVIIVANCRFLIAGIASSCQSIRNSKSDPQELIRGMSLRVVSLTFLLGISWIFGFLLYTEWLAFAFIFTIANGLQGVVIFVDRCILNKKIRNAITENWNCFTISVKIKWKKSTVTSKVPTEQTNLQNDSFSNMFDRSFSFSNESIEEIIPRIRWENFKNSSFNNYSA